MSAHSKTRKPKEDPRWLDQPENVRKIIRWFYGLCGLVILVDVAFSMGWHKHAAFSEEVGIHVIETLPAFYGLYGFLACVGMVYISKLMRNWKGKKLLMREEDYWDK